jgi:hypothetical protein
LVKILERRDFYKTPDGQGYYTFKSRRYNGYIEVMSFEKVKNDVHRNISLVILDKEIIPSDIVKKFEEEFSLENTPVRMHRAGILEGTRWWTDKKEIVPSSWDMLQNVPEQKGPEPLF